MNKKKIMGVTFIIGIIVIVVAVYLYYQQYSSEDKENLTIFDTTTEEDNVAEIQGETVGEVNNTNEYKSTTDDKEQEEASTTTEKKQNAPLPDNYEWDEKRWGEPPQIIYDFAENQEKFDFIVKEVDSLLSEEDGFSTWMENGKIYYDSKYEKQLNSELKKNIDYLLNNTSFYDFTKYKFGHWNMEYNQDKNRDRYVYTMIYDPELTEEEEWGVGYIKVVGDWYFIAAPLG